MSKEKFNIKVGDKVISDDRFHGFGFIDGEGNIIDIELYKDIR